MKENPSRIIPLRRTIKAQRDATRLNDMKRIPAGMLKIVRSLKGKGGKLVIDESELRIIFAAESEL